MFKDLFRKPKYVTVRAETVKKDIPDGLWQKCGQCGEILYIKPLDKNFRVCHKCGFYFRLAARERLSYLLDADSFTEFDVGMTSVNTLEFPGYELKLEEAQKRTGLSEAIITGTGAIKGQPLVIGVMEPNFMMGSMGSVVGEKITRALETAIERRLPVVIFSASGGARMQEGLLSLMQMAKTCAAVAKLGEAGMPFISVLTDPTTGGVLASFAFLGDIIISEPGALIAFTGPRVIEQTIHQKLPPGFQTAEFLLQHGMIDMIVERANLKATLAKLLQLHSPGGAVYG